jgi:hypothetical protein
MVCDSDDLYDIGVVEVDDRKWKTFQKISAGAVKVGRPAMRALRHNVQALINASKKTHSCVQTALRILNIASLNLTLRFRM